MLLGKGHGQQAELRKTRPGLAAPALRLRHGVLARLEAVAIGHEPIDRVLEQPLFVGKIEIHSHAPVMAGLDPAIPVG
jgi:hypothetical protein